MTTCRLTKQTLINSKPSYETIADLDRNRTKRQAQIDAFMREANARDACDSDLDQLRAIISRYAKSRYDTPSQSLDEARRRYNTTQQFHKTFVGSPHFRAYIFDEGDCSRELIAQRHDRCDLVYDIPNAPMDTDGIVSPRSSFNYSVSTYIETCRINEFAFYRRIVRSTRPIGCF